jgi:hypothetical protein
MEVLRGKYLQLGFKEFMSTTCNMDQRWNLLVEHINFVKDQTYFYVSGQGLNNVELSNALQDEVTHGGATMTLVQLLAKQGIFAFMQKSKKSNSSKIICQHATTMEHDKKGAKNSKQHVALKTWFVEKIIKKECSGWTATNFSPRRANYIGVPNNKPIIVPPVQTDAVPGNVWRQKAEERSRTSKLSGTGESIDSIQTQYTEQLAANKTLTESNKKLQDENQTLAQKLENLTTQKDNQEKELADQGAKIRDQEEKMKEMQRNLALLMTERTKTDNDEHMQNEGKRTTPSTPQAGKYHQQQHTSKMRRTTPEPRQLYSGRTSPPRSPTLARIGEAANQTTHQHRKPSPTYAASNGGATN